MIIVDIYVPSVDKNYNFSLSEDVEVSTIISEITDMISQKEQSALIGNVDALNLYDLKEKKILGRDYTLFQCNIRTGSSLMLV